MRPNIKLLTLAFILSVNSAFAQTIGPAPGGSSGVTSCSALTDSSAFCSGTDAVNLTGTISNSQLSGSYTGITGVGTLSAGSIPTSLLTGTISNSQLNADVFSSVHTWANTQTFTVAPVFTNQSGTRTALGLATIASSGSASDLSTGTVAASRGGAGTITGALKGNGSGVVSQAACADLSNAATYCSAVLGQLPGITSNTAASTGNIGEIITSSVSCGTPTSILNNTGLTIASVTLGAGDYDLWGSISWVGTATTVVYVLSSINTTADSASNALGNTFFNGLFLNSNPFATLTASQPISAPVSGGPVQISGSTTYRLNAQIGFSGGTASACGTIYARRRR